MAWEEWERLKADASAHGSAQMQLNQVADSGNGAPGGAASERLKSDKKAWAKAGEGTKGLKDDIGKALTQLENGQAGLGGTEGCQSAAAQKELYDSWKKYVGDVSSRCTELGGLLEQSGHDLAGTDDQLKAELDRIKTKYQDTEAVGGQAKGK
ncbi:hypothetical protein [Streptomyces minutiscleroticus]|uniref:Uncharacterized protein n=1 Tax=Streptomyces minutiscleroticus TaxID=68238 RepID=A0A918NEH2_9ACTN|nr:hypothetical protein [Streptomyces minutiscleroticus]GGX62045.1 hypothetical protein GCM10010358_15480 [Streptomyces minutiscleroticus]